MYTSLLSFSCIQVPSTRNTLQNSATHCNQLQRAARREVRQNVLAFNILPFSYVPFRTFTQVPSTCNILQHTATRCNALQHVATHVPLLTSLLKSLQLLLHLPLFCLLLLLLRLLVLPLLLLLAIPPYSSEHMRRLYACEEGDKRGGKRGRRRQGVRGFESNITLVTFKEINMCMYKEILIQVRIRMYENIYT